MPTPSPSWPLPSPRAPSPPAPPPAASTADHTPPPSGWRRAWQRWHRQVIGVFAVLVLALVGWRLQSLDWPAAWRAVRATPASTLTWAALIAVVGHANYGAFDLVARRWLTLGVPAWRIWWSSTVSYAFTLNCGSLIGGAALRLRLLTAAGVRATTVAQVVVLAVLTNWLGYAVVTGGLLASGSGFLAEAVAAPAGAGEQAAHNDQLQGYATTLQGWLGSTAAVAVGAGLIAVALLWLGAAALWSRQRITWRDHHLTLPTLPLAGMQLLLGAANWLWLAGVMWCLVLPQAPDLPFRLVLAAQVLASLAGLVARVPGGLGVFEAVYWVMLGSQVAQGPLLGALLLFRIVYYFAPLTIALAGYLVLMRHPAQPGGGEASPEGAAADKAGAS